MQTCLFLDEDAPAPAPAAPPARPAPAGQPPARIDAKAEYEGRQRDLERLAAEWEDLHAWVLQRHLRLLACPRTGDDERSDILIWLNAPLVFDRPPAPFSFQACLALYDARLDPVAFQQLVGRANQRVRDRRHAPAA
ncbi:MAG: hypothetical protein EA420_16505 [Candidatus Competibacteraceae bacterium]|nr:MAG: hypothetical protein EA420_16505 [Candidatus Competibacteraceae bacterium]